MTDSITELYKGILECLKEANEQRKMYPYEYRAVAAKVGGTEETFDSDKLDPGFIYVITNFFAENETTDAQVNGFGYFDGAEYFKVHQAVSGTINQGIGWSGKVILVEGDKLRFNFRGGNASDVLVMQANGYKLKR